MATSISREARRRRIVDRGADRLALITGRINSLPSSSSSHLSDQPSPVISQGEARDFGSSSLKHESSSEPVQLETNGDGAIVEPNTRVSETISEDSKPSTLDIDDKLQSTPILSTIQNPSIFTSGVEHHSEPQTRHHRKFFTANQISSAVTASEITRIYCSLAVSILVFLSYVGFPILGSYFIKSVILSRPLYLLLVTNISVVLAYLLETQRGSISSGEETSSASLVSAFGLADQFGKALELGLVLQHVVGALFMDCSVYSIVIVFLLSLAHRFGW